jgi:hypothetical protein
MSTLAAAGGVYMLLSLGHRWGDHGLQTTHQAVTKGKPGGVGRAACVRHVATLTVTQAGLLAGADLLLGTVGESVGSRGAVAAALTLNAITHYWADRRTTLDGLASAMRQAEFYRFGTALASGAYVLDQDWHRVWLVLAALLIVAPTFAFGAAIAVVSLVLFAAAVAASRYGRRMDITPQLNAREETS